MDALITLSGNVGTDVEFTEGDGWSYARFRLACTPRFVRNGEWVDAETTWINVRTSHRTAINVKESIRKGDPVLVTGRLRTHAWTNGDGERFDRLVVEATSLGHDLTRGTAAFTKNERYEAEAKAGEDDGDDSASPETAQTKVA